MSRLISQYQVRIESVLQNLLSVDSLLSNVSEHLNQAMQYSTLGGGKRVRALLVYASGLAVNAPLNRLDAIAAALECIHAYSLIHDDLPAMDDDKLRRGKATTHIKFDEATAILAGDGLLTLAFDIVNNEKTPLTDAQCRKISNVLTQSSGANGMVGGQMLDILATNQAPDLFELEKIHRNKTGALINAAVMCGAYCADEIETDKLTALSNYANHLGLAFQVVDDILDIESNTDVLGKTNGSDYNLGKSTYPALIGLVESKQLAQTLYQQSMACIDTIGDNSALLIELSDLVVNRVS